MLCQQGHPTCDPRKTFIDDMIELIKYEESQPNNSVIVMLDANEFLYDKSNDLQRLLKDTSLIDTFNRKLDCECNIATYEFGKKCIDYIFTSANLLPHVANVGYLAFGENDIVSDHRGLFIDLHESFIENKIEFQRPEKRNIGSKSKQTTIYKYKKGVHDQFTEHNIYRRAESMLLESKSPSVNNVEFEAQLNALDTQITEIIL